MIRWLDTDSISTKRVKISNYNFYVDIWNKYIDGEVTTEEFMNHQSKHKLLDVWGRSDSKEKKEMIKQIHYRAKIKLHGSNMGISNKNIMSRNGVCGPTSPHQKFATQNSEHVKYLQSILPDDWVLFGELIGPKMQKNVACSQIPKLTFAIFAIQVKDSVIYDPSDIKKILTKDKQLPETFKILPFESEVYDIDFTNKKETKSIVESIMLHVAKVDKEDPWVLKEFKIKGHGEGLVLYPICHVKEIDGGYSTIPRNTFKQFLFKAKGKSHKQYVKSDPEEVAKLDTDKKFVNNFLQGPRFQQGYDDVFKEAFDRSRMDEFVKWMISDIKKESSAELELNKLTWSENMEKIIKTACWRWANVNKLL